MGASADRRRRPTRREGTPVEVMDKLTILADAAKYDAACTSSGVSRGGKPGTIGTATNSGCCHTFPPTGGASPC